jgi:hypothetical protein
MRYTVYSFILKSDFLETWMGRLSVLEITEKISAPYSFVYRVRGSLTGGAGLRMMEMAVLQ